MVQLCGGEHLARTRGWRFNVKRRNLLVIATMLGFIASLEARKLPRTDTLQMPPSSRPAANIVLTAITRK